MSPQNSELSSRNQQYLDLKKHEGQSVDFNEIKLKEDKLAQTLTDRRRKSNDQFNIEKYLEHGNTSENNISKSFKWLKLNKTANTYKPLQGFFMP